MAGAGAGPAGGGRSAGPGRGGRHCGSTRTPAPFISHRGPVQPLGSGGGGAGGLGRRAPPSPPPPLRPQADRLRCAAVSGAGQGGGWTAERKRGFIAASEERAPLRGRGLPLCESGDPSSVFGVREDPPQPPPPPNREGTRRPEGNGCGVLLGRRLRASRWGRGEGRHKVFLKVRGVLRGTAGCSPPGMKESKASLNGCVVATAEDGLGAPSTNQGYRVPPNSYRGRPTRTGLKKKVSHQGRSWSWE